MTAPWQSPGNAGPRAWLSQQSRAGSQIRTAFEAALKRAGIVVCRFHDPRHTAASHLVMRGASLQDVKEVLGHADLRMTLRHGHLSPAHMRGAVERLEGLGQVTPAPTPETASESQPVGTQIGT